MDKCAARWPTDTLTAVAERRSPSLLSRLSTSVSASDCGKAQKVLATRPEEAEIEHHKPLRREVVQFCITLIRYMTSVSVSLTAERWAPCQFVW